MKSKLKHFNKLSAKQIKTYTSLFVMSLFSLSALASPADVPLSTEAVVNASMDTSYDEELVLESWMHEPFAESLAYEAVQEAELVLESWMKAPFTPDNVREEPRSNSTCIPAP